MSVVAEMPFLRTVSAANGEKMQGHSVGPLKKNEVSHLSVCFQQK
jgi:hypothetical protein